MARNVNHYFNTLGGKGEQRLVEDLIVESIRINGMKVYYIPRTPGKLDPVFGEDPLVTFKTSFPIEMYFDNPSEGFGGDRYMISKFGLEMRETANFIVSRRRFNQATKSDGFNNIPITNYTLPEQRPMEGSLIYLPLTNDLFQINFAEHESIFYQVGYRYIWRIDVEKYDYSHEKFNTGVPAIDAVNIFENQDSVTNDPLADNNTLKTRAQTNLNTTEKNIFGDPI
jgi:Virus neck protein